MKRVPPLTAEQIQARVLHRDGLILVIDKPAGLAVHAGPSKAPNLEDVVRRRYGDDAVDATIAGRIPNE